MDFGDSGTPIDVSVRRYEATYSYQGRGNWMGCVELSAQVARTTMWASHCDAGNAWGLISADADLRTALQTSLAKLLCAFNGWTAGMHSGGRDRLALHTTFTPLARCCSVFSGAS
jgi:hypothetical protein